MLNEIQLQKLINKGIEFFSVSKDDNDKGYVVSKLTSEGWNVSPVVTDQELSDELNKYKFRPDVIVDIEDEISSVINYIDFRWHAFF